MTYEKKSNLNIRILHLKDMFITYLFCVLFMTSTFGRYTTGPVVGIPITDAPTTVVPTDIPTDIPTVAPTDAPSSAPPTGAVRCNTCFEPLTLFTEGCCGGVFQMVAVPCTFEIKYKFTFPPTQECGTVVFLNPSTGNEDYTIHCNGTSKEVTVQSLNYNGEYVDTIIPNLSEVECAPSLLTFDLYMNVADQEGLNLTNYIVDDEGIPQYMTLVL